MTIELTPEMLTVLINEEVEKFTSELAAKSQEKSTTLTLEGLRKIIQEEMAEACGMDPHMEPVALVPPHSHEADVPLYEEDADSTDERDSLAEFLEVDDDSDAEPKVGENELLEGEDELPEDEDGEDDGGTSGESSEIDDEPLNEGNTKNRWKLIAGI